MPRLSDPLTPRILRTTEQFIDALESIGIHTVEDLMRMLPRTHEDLSQVRTLDDVSEGEKVSLRGIVSDLKMIRTRKQHKILVQAVFTDANGNQCRVVFFNQPHIARMLPTGTEVVLTGKIGTVRGKLTLQSPTFERGDRKVLLHSGHLVPMYTQPSTSTGSILSTRWFREKMALVRSAMKDLPETLPKNIVESEGLLGRAKAIEELHFPSSGEMVLKAQERFAFEELYALQLQALERKRQWQEAAQERLRIPMAPELIKAFFRSLNFTPTGSQKIAIYEILKDLEKTVPMSRLLEGDVGSGKTLVAVAVMAEVVAAGGQCALMVPTEVLAKQHAEGISKLLLNFHVFLDRASRQKAERRVERPLDAAQSAALEENMTSQFHLPVVSLLTGSTPAPDAERIKLGLATGTIDIVIGTHALIQASVAFKDLRLAIIDEQHRFGVEQRRALKDKGSPHVLSMTATPIPRTLALTAYGDHDLSVLLEKPGNRKPIKTKVVPPAGRRTIELFIDKEISGGRPPFAPAPLRPAFVPSERLGRAGKTTAGRQGFEGQDGAQPVLSNAEGGGRQVYVICPLIKESTELADVRNVTEEAKRLQDVFPRRRIALLHGQLRPEEKDRIMRDFKERKTDILVSTSVIEVGIDVPNASIILIEGAERFGLAQLHQLRGRTGRADHQSYCFLCTTDQAQARSERLQAMEHFTDGFRLAEIDLKLRGPGELYGTRQSGIPEIRVGALMNPALVMRARKAAERMLGMGEEKTGVKVGV